MCWYEKERGELLSQCYYTMHAAYYRVLLEPEKKMLFTRKIGVWKKKWDENKAAKNVPF